MLSTERKDHGFITMPVEATISEPDFPAILSRYDLGDYRGFKTFANGAGQTTVLLETSRGAAVLRYYENRSEVHVDFEVEACSFLKSMGYPIPAIFSNRAGELRGTYRGKPYLLIEFIEGGHGSNPNQHFDAGEAAVVIEAVARLHNLTKGWLPDWSSSRKAYDPAYCWRQFCKKHADLIETEEGRWFKGELNGLAFPTAMPKGLCHADFNFGNFLFRSGEVVAVLDFDMSFFGFLIYDIASLIYWWAMPPEQCFRGEAARFIIYEYEKHRPLSDTERVHIIDALKLIILLGISWGERPEIPGDRQKIEQLKTAGADIFG